MKRSEEDYVSKNIDGDKETAYNVNNNLMSVRDLQKDFDTSLLLPEKAAEYDKYWADGGPEERLLGKESEPKKTVKKKDGE